MVARERDHRIMDASSLHSFIRFDCNLVMFRPPSCAAMLKHGRIGTNFPAPPLMCRVSRRSVFELIGLNAIVSYVNPAIGAPPQPKIIRTRKLSSGVIIQDIVEGDGPLAHQGDLVELNYVCRRSNGYFIHSTVDQLSGESRPVILPLDEKQTIRGLNDVLIGMRVGGKSRALIPPSVGYVNENLKPIPEEFGHRRRILSHADELLVFEVQLLKVL
ncbi:hypothetical protein Scep_029021 [Stephania cephalantha]|uniref:peptidylprolyl isomerase n=1 Tax=Stephania cephalantha TaxID=152367 RepID=A0AAP0HK62_9MAGN